MKRNWAVRPDPETGIANRQEIVEALMDGEAMLHRAGGVLQVVVHRMAPEDAVPGEMVTIAAVFEWKDRTDAKAQPEVPAVAPLPAPDPDPTPEEFEARLEAEEKAASAEEEFLREAEEAEDESSMEPAAQ